MSSLTFTLIQSNLHWENKAANIKMWEEKIVSIKEKTEIVVLPEMFSTGFSMKPESFAEKMDGPTVEWMKKISAQQKIILTGSLIIEEEGKHYNRLLWVLPNGQTGTYDKRHLFAYAAEDQFYTPGLKRLIASVKGWKINLQVCYDLRFPVWARQQPTPNPSQEGKLDPEYDILIYVANWPERRNIAWKSLLRARAIENQCYVIGVNRVGNDGNQIYHSGDSMVIDPPGEILYHKEHDEDIFTITLSKDRLEKVRNKFPFWKDADEFNILT
ncbi:MAG: amidohydrolase [Sphingobacteriales bacterium]|nr:amidohydrolase [Sphingobacteriales bacterium]MBI3718252.1 amidohydrolase [Sphingobacteriales bacterium]